MAVEYRKYKSEILIHHFDRGYQYCSNDYQEVLNKNGIKCSKTESYNQYANDVAERINGILKQEFIDDNNNLALPIMKALISDSIKIYNHKRPHYSCYMKTPEMMHNKGKSKLERIKTRIQSTKPTGFYKLGF